MCNPAMIVPIAGAAFSFIGQSAAAKSADKQIQAGYGLQADAFDAQRKEIKATAQTEISDRVRQAQIERGVLRTQQGESGLTGTGRLDRDISFQSGTDITRIETNASNRTKNANRQQAGAHHRSTTDALKISRPSLLGTGLQIAGAVANNPSAPTTGGKKKTQGFSNSSNDPLDL